MSRAHVRTLLTLAVLLLAAGSTQRAFSLGVDEVNRMCGVIDDNTLIPIIENSGEKFALTPEQETKLRKTCSDRILNAMKATATGGGTTGGGGSGTGNLGPIIGQAAKDMQRAFEISSAVAESDRKKQAAAARQAEIRRGFAKVDQLVRDWPAVGDKWAAIATCHEFLTEFGDVLDTSSGEFYAATWCKGRAYHDLGIHYGAAPLLFEVVKVGVDGPMFEDAVRALVTSADTIGFYSPGMADALRGLYIEPATLDLQDELHYFTGKVFMETVKDTPDKDKAYMSAIGELELVREESPLRPKALYAMAVMQASDQLKQLKTGVQNFQKAILLAEQRDDDQYRDVIELSYMALARIAYEVGNYDGALYYYQKVDRFSARYPQALFESAWTYFLKGDHRRALGTFHSLQSPYYSDYYFPDLWLLEATLYLNLCRYEEAKQALQFFTDVYINRLPQLSQFNNDPAALENPAIFYDAIANYYAQKESAPAGGQAAPTLHPLFLEAVLANVSFYNTFKSVEELRREMTVLSERVGSLGGVGQQLMAQMEATRDSKLLDAGIRTRTLLGDIEAQLAERDATSTEISIDIDVAEKDLIETCLQLRAQGKDCEFTVNEEAVLFLVADDWQYWPFENEYWVDEVGAYKSYLSDRCGQVEALSEVAPPAEEP
jgi:tetratricopeptide (TPR) repeat protein